MPDQNYIALYRKYRPRDFDDVRGRDAIVRTLKNQIVSGRIGHSYLFCGTRGTGKTTIARIFARAVNCENQHDGNPCGECPTCRAIAAEANLNVTELDAASNNSVDDIRAIVDQVEYSPTQGRFRVFIIDEVHMLSNAAFNALLKTLEEPPSYVIFILATTEPNKLPVTILSRCQRYDFGRLSTDVIEGRLREVAQMESDLYLGIHDGKVTDALKVLDAILLQGRELMQFVTDFTWYLRNLMLLKASEETARSLDISADNLRMMIDQARMSDMEEIMRCIRVFSALPDLIRYSPNRRILTEMTIIRACRSAMDDGAEEGGTLLLDKIKNRVREMETQIYNNEMAIEAIAGGAASTGFGGAGHSGAGKVGGEKETSADSSREPAVAQELPPALPEEIREIVSNWSQYASEAPHGSRRLALRNARLSLGDHGQLLIIFEKEYGNPYIYQRRDDNGESSRRVDDDRRQLQQYLQGKVGKAIEIEYRVLDRGGRITDNYVDLLSLVEPGAIRMSVETEDM